MQTPFSSRFVWFGAALRNGVRRRLRRLTRWKGSNARAAPPKVAPVETWQWQLHNELAALAGFGEQVLAYLDAAHPPKPDGATNSAVLLILDELLTNVIKYAHPGEIAGRRFIIVLLVVGGGDIRIEIEDDGIPFDPTADAPAPVDGVRIPLEERAVGGWGLSLVRRTADAMAYRRAHGRNYVTLHKRFPTTRTAV